MRLCQTNDVCIKDEMPGGRAGELHLVAGCAAH